MPLTTEQLFSIGKNLNIYLGSVMFIAGLLGSSMNIWLFTRHYFRKSPCSRLILASSLFDILHLIVALFVRILAEGFHIDIASLTVTGCRIRYYLITFSAYASIGCRCFAAFDRYACTSRSITLRQWSSLKVVYRFLTINILFWACFAFPNFFFFDLVTTPLNHVICHISNQIYSDYFAYFVNPVLYFALPLIILISLTILTHRNLRLMSKTRRLQKVERQLTSMIILQALANSISSIPYGIQFFYAVITLNFSKNNYRRAQEHLFLQITRLSYYTNFISAFYIYYIASEQIRSFIKWNLKTRKSKTMKLNALLYEMSRNQLIENERVISKNFFNI